MAIARWICSMGAAIALVAPSAWAADDPLSISRGGPEIKFITNDHYEGFLYGGRAMRYVTPSLYVGLMAYGTLPLIGKDFAPAFGYGGGLAGWEGRLGAGVSYDLNLHVGLTSDILDGTPNPAHNQISLEPSVAVGLPVPFLKATRVSLCAGYLMLPWAFSNSGPTIGLRWETKMVSRPVDDDTP